MKVAAFAWAVISSFSISAAMTARIILRPDPVVPAPRTSNRTPARASTAFKALKTSWVARIGWPAVAR
jgi:hypothetical protein